MQWLGGARPCLNPNATTRGFCLGQWQNTFLVWSIWQLKTKERHTAGFWSALVLKSPLKVDFVVSSARKKAKLRYSYPFTFIILQTASHPEFPFWKIQTETNTWLSLVVSPWVRPEDQEQIQIFSKGLLICFKISSFLSIFDRWGGGGWGRWAKITDLTHSSHLPLSPMPGHNFWGNMCFHKTMFSLQKDRI